MEPVQPVARRDFGTGACNMAVTDIKRASPGFPIYEYTT